MGGNTKYFAHNTLLHAAIFRNYFRSTMATQISNIVAVTRSEKNSGGIVVLHNSPLSFFQPFPPTNMSTTNDDCMFADVNSGVMRGGTYQTAASTSGSGMLPTSREVQGCKYLRSLSLQILGA
jgi:hypothetical protein